MTYQLEVFGIQERSLSMKLKSCDYENCFENVILKKMDWQKHKEDIVDILRSNIALIGREFK